MKRIILYIAFSLLALLSCKSSTFSANMVVLALESKSNSAVTGTATFSEKNGEVTLTTKIIGLKQGEHGIHIHEKADCSAPDAASAGGHWNPTFKRHGKWTDAEHHKGDIGNITANENGVATLTFKTNEWCIGCGDATKDILGKSLIIHEKPDDFVSQPTGNAGARVACSAIIR